MSRSLGKPKHILRIPEFSKVATGLREEFDSSYADVRATDARRFVWEPWYVVDQYSVLRTPASLLFGEKAYARLLEELLRFGKENLGCHGLSPPWVSLYLDGAFQNLHTDSPHGPWAYVYSLTEWRSRTFQGGETMLARPDLLNYWSDLSSGPAGRAERGREWSDFFLTNAPDFNQLLCFDPRIPHGVREVRGVRDPRAGRLVVHGWFVESRPFVEGALAGYAKLEEWLEAEAEKFSPLFSEFPTARGVLTLRLRFNAAGNLVDWTTLTHTLIGLGELTPLFRRELAEILRDVRAPRARGGSSLTLPLQF